MILSSYDIQRRLPQLIEPAVEAHINPASLDIRIGNMAILENGNAQSLNSTYWLEPGEFVLVSTFEKITVPNDLAVELRLKSSIARQGYNHSLAFWFDPGWEGKGTMEIQNINRQKKLPLKAEMLFAQLIFHQLSNIPLKPYSGKYQWAHTVEGAKL